MMSAPVLRPGHSGAAGCLENRADAPGVHRSHRHKGTVPGQMQIGPTKRKERASVYEKE